MARTLAIFAIFLPVIAHAGEIDFARDIRPILSNHCFQCHGPDEKTRSGELSLHTAKGAQLGGSSEVPTIVPGKPQQSELVRRINTEKPSDLMPPKSANKPLSTKQKQLLADWIAAGGKYVDHWAFQPPKRPLLPMVDAQQWPQNGIDHFIFYRLQQAGLSPGKLADKSVFIRRAYLDIVGLPPTPTETEQFVNDPDPDASERLIDRLLASPRFGEHWARVWLDLARYADTNGFEKDRPRTMWLYRDWVIQALNNNMPYDRFTIEQLAGDLLPGASEAQLIATGFHRNTMLNEEGGIDPLEYRWLAMNDRIATTGTVWLGLTLNCCQCHTHKFDPISHDEYYRLFAIFNNFEEPTISVTTQEIQDRRKLLEVEIQRQLKELPSRFPIGTQLDPKLTAKENRQKNFERLFAAWLKEERMRAVDWQIIRPAKVSSNLPHLEVEADDAVFVSGDQSKRDEMVVEMNLPKNTTAIRLEVLADPRLPAGGPGRVYYEGPLGDFVLSELSIKQDSTDLAIAEATASFQAARGQVGGAIDQNPLTAWTINGGQGKSHQAVFRLKKPVSGTVRIHLVCEKYYAANLGKFRLAATTAKGEVVARSLPAKIEVLLAIDEEKLTSGQVQELRDYYLSVTPLLSEARAAIQRLQKAVPDFPTALVLQERPKDRTRPTFLHHRGEWLSPRNVVQPGVPAFLPEITAPIPNRLDFAKWLMAKEHPLTARVMVNRVWAAIFGKGLVTTLDDFGYQSNPPSHPELLDWLAVEFMESGWDVKWLIRLIVTSSTYQQTSNVTPQLLKQDPDNKWYSRMPSRRLTGEELRDLYLVVSDKLAVDIGGPSVFPPQPESVTREGTFAAYPWKTSTGSDRFRRSIYTFKRRTSPFAFLKTFDAPSGEACVARRESTNTPLQALTQLNDAMLLELTRTLAQSVYQSRPSNAERVTELFLRTVSRLPSTDERKLLTQFFDQQIEFFQQHPSESERLCTPNFPKSAEFAAWIVLCRAVLNLDEAITRN